jgi:hypothetical protein
MHLTPTGEISVFTPKGWANIAQGEALGNGYGTGNAA